MRSSNTLPASQGFDILQLLWHTWVSAVLALLVFVLALGGLALGYSLAFSGAVFPGVHVAGVDIGGLTQEEAIQRLSSTLTYPQQGRVAFQDGGQYWIAHPVELGLIFNPTASVVQAMEIGRRGGPAARITEQFNAWYSGENLAPVLMFDESAAVAYIANLAGLVDKPTIEAELAVQGLEVIVRPGQIGRTIDQALLLEQTRAQVETLTDGILQIPIAEQTPAILDASQQAEIARTILSAPMTLRVPGEEGGVFGPWTLSQEQLAGMLVIERVEAPEGDTYQVTLNPESLRPMLEELAAPMVLDPQNARFIFNDDTRQLEVIQDAVIGRHLLIDESLQVISEKARAGEHSIDLIFDYSLPEVTNDATAESLGITELVSAQTTYFYGSSASRIQNITTASSKFHGLLIPPGGTLSMSDVLGDVTLDNGYAEALIIYGDRTIKGVGGGVCQVSTTLFRTVFFGGFPIVERHPHAYRVTYYEMRADGGINSNLAGLDAAIFTPVVDFKFTNDTGSWLLMETYVSSSARTLTWKFYSTGDGRSVEWTTTGPTNIVDAPKPVYQENASLPSGTIKQVDWAAQGADVTVNRTVYRNGEVYFSDRVFTHYQPWRAVYEYGPGTELPPEAQQDDNDE